MINACQHRGATLTRDEQGQPVDVHLPVSTPGATRATGGSVKVKAPGEYCEGFDKSTRGLKKARIESYKGFVFVSLDVDGTDSAARRTWATRKHLLRHDRRAVGRPANWKCCRAGPPIPTTATGNCRTKTASTVITSAPCTTTTCPRCKHRQQTNAEKGDHRQRHARLQQTRRRRCRDRRRLVLVQQRPQRAVQRHAEPGGASGLRDHDAAPGRGIRPGTRPSG